MTAAIASWQDRRTTETEQVEAHLRPHFEQVDCYRYNSAAIRVRVIDPKFEGLSRSERDGWVEPYLDQLPPETQRDIVTLLTLAPSDLARPAGSFREYWMNQEFEEPSPSTL